MTDASTTTTTTTEDSSSGQQQPTPSAPSHGRTMLCDLVSSDSYTAVDGDDSTTIPSRWEESFADNVGHLWCPSRGIAILDEPPTALEFSRDYVRASRPCIIRNAVLDYHHHANGGVPTRRRIHMPPPPLHMTLDDIMERLDPDTTQLMVDVTPDGHGDCVRRVVLGNGGNGGDGIKDKNNRDCLMFVQPKECLMSLREFRDRLRRQQSQQDINSKAAPFDSQAAMGGEMSSFSDINGLPAIPMASTTTSKEVADKNDPYSGGSSNSSSRESSFSFPDNSIVYYSRQNDCLRTPEQEDDSPSTTTAEATTTTSSITDLASLFPSGFDWAEQALGTELDAVNLWMGNQQSVSSMHKDHYENLFYVASGEKIFTVCPPADVPFLYQHVDYPSGQFEIQMAEGDVDDDKSLSWNVRPFSSSSSKDQQATSTSSSSNKVRWIYPDVSPLAVHNKENKKKDSRHNPGNPAAVDMARRSLLQTFPLLRHTHPMEIRVQAGELLYLPSLWFHRVTQSCETIGVNYWYDMHFDGGPMWCYFQLLQELRVMPLLVSPRPPPSSSSSLTNSTNTAVTRGAAGATTTRSEINKQESKRSDAEYAQREQRTFGI